MKKDRKDELESIYLTMAKPLYYYLLKLTGSHLLAEELVQETFYRATVSLEFYEGGSVKGWLFKVARHVYLDEWRRKSRWKWIPLSDYLLYSSELVSPYGIPEEELIAKEVTIEVSDIMKLLPENYRTLLYLREYEQFSYEELAETMDLSLNQVKVYLHRARGRFKELSERIGKNFGRGEHDGVE